MTLGFVVESFTDDQSEILKHHNAIPQFCRISHVGSLFRD